jgi:phage terminase large subunit
MAGKFNQYKPPQSQVSQDDIRNLFQSWRESPLKFAQEAFNWKEDERLTSQQVGILNILGDLYKAKSKAFYKEPLTESEEGLAQKFGISIKSGHGIGKDALVSIIIIWFVLLFTDYKGLCTATSGKQLKNVLWAEIEKWRNKCKFGSAVKIFNEKIFKEDTKNWFVAGATVNRNTPPDKQAETLQGYHEDYLLIVVDEASGVPNPVFSPLTGTLTGKFNIALLLSNPTRRSGYFYDSHNKNRDQWIAVTCNSEESERVSKTQIETILKDCGGDKNHPFYRIRVLGEFAVEDEQILIPYDWIEDAKDRIVEVDRDEPIIFGVDVASSEGNDKSVIVIRQGQKILDIVQYSKVDADSLIGWICVEDKDGIASAINIDALGVGDGVYSPLKKFYASKRRYDVIHGVKVSNPSRWQEKFYQLRDELWWTVREQFEKGLISLPSNNRYTDELIKQLSSIKLEDPEASRAGLIKIESKQHMRSRGLKSPDIADALCLTYFRYAGSQEIEENRRDAWDDDDFDENLTPISFMGV